MLFILLVSAVSLPAGAQDQELQRYRVEVLVMRQLEADDPGDVTSRLTDYSAARDLLLPADDEEVVCPSDVAAAQAGPATENDTQVPEIELPLDPNLVVRIEEMGPEMAEAWRRLRLSGPFRPLQYLSWEQGNQPPFPLLRLRDEEIVHVNDPFADMRLALETSLEGGAGKRGTPVDPCKPDDETDGAIDGFDARGLPQPTDYYRLDGTVSLVRSRFLHLAYDLEWRERLDTATPEPVTPAAVAGQGIRGRNAFPPSNQQPVAEFRVHSLEQSRQVRSGRMEYFDGPVIGVLAWITPIPVAEPAER
ncbi:MAG: peptidoglycan binding protein CsiV [Gammaproteobacteria bacterium]|nr:peptidoglycan binding protein CsiV [Gammaproteobacteria bacterium]MBT8051215.1 peptidoglycan binding protein CsiV [Gammaproteobacteria bacterium]NNJ78859.1 hypothetical protein [Xanthomonadales bacterium]